MTKEQKKAIAKRLLNKYDAAMAFMNEEVFRENKRFNPLYSEFIGMEQLLKTIGIEYEFHYNEYHENYGVTVDGYTLLSIK